MKWMIYVVLLLIICTSNQDRIFCRLHNTSLEMLQCLRTQIIPQIYRSSYLCRYVTIAAESNSQGTDNTETPPMDETKVLLSAGSSIASLIDPRRHDMIAALGETTGELALRNILQTMQASIEGKRILEQKPRINTRTVDFNRLRSLTENTFGYAYAKFLDDNNVTPDTRMEVRFLQDPLLAYVMTRYRECHDLVHTVLGMPTNMLGEVTVKWVEALNNGLPMCYGGAVFGAMRLRPKQRKEYVARYLPLAIKNGMEIKPLLSIYWEERWEQDLEDLRTELRITNFKQK
ncbi:ubiquinone biosynthesis protein COQ4 homolog, mitochondrial isoform X2 [Eurosta solidaginis]|uniref:ubiquinone biosynthesis protein COQ4 homolog, mitochondrial isoform X2 n=1 Tax=Eurosta solidaginis TaxID=178769 RepID=UPI0035316DD0